MFWLGLLVLLFVLMRFLVLLLVCLVGCGGFSVGVCLLFVFWVVLICMAVGGCWWLLLWVVACFWLRLLCWVCCFCGVVGFSSFAYWCGTVSVASGWIGGFCWLDLVVAYLVLGVLFGLTLVLCFVCRAGLCEGYLVLAVVGVGVWFLVVLIAAWCWQWCLRVFWLFVRVGWCAAVSVAF